MRPPAAVPCVPGAFGGQKRHQIVLGTLFVMAEPSLRPELHTLENFVPPFLETLGVPVISPCVLLNSLSAVTS